MFKKFIKKRKIKWANAHYNMRLQTFKKCNTLKQSCEAVFVGDSITEGYDFSEFFSSSILNRGISGDTTQGLLCRLNESIFDINADSVFIQIGTNDINRDISPAQTILNYKEILYKVREKLKDKKLYIISVYPVNFNCKAKISRNMVANRKNDDIIFINEKLAELANVFNAIYINVHSKLVDKNGELFSDATTDGLHLNFEGYKIVTKELHKHIV